eukprot:15337012-Heterocapsa_arctica.AAC.1
MSSIVVFIGPSSSAAPMVSLTAVMSSFLWHIVHALPDSAFFRRNGYAFWVSFVRHDPRPRMARSAHSSPMHGSPS